MKVSSSWQCAEGTNPSPFSSWSNGNKISRNEPDFVAQRTVNSNPPCAQRSKQSSRAARASLASSSTSLRITLVRLSLSVCLSPLLSSLLAFRSNLQVADVLTIDNRNRPWIRCAPEPGHPRGEGGIRECVRGWCGVVQEDAVLIRSTVNGLLHCDVWCTCIIPRV